MLVETRLGFGPDAGERAARQEAAGYAGTFTRETDTDPFLPLALAAGGTERIELGTAVAIAFARSPMTLAYTAHNLQTLTGGRFVLGLGTQVRGHIVRRFSMGWDAPVARMRDYLDALRAIWAAWREGTPLKHEGAFYTHTLMTPAFTPPPHSYSDPPVLLAAVGPAMTDLACERADGLLVHPFSGHAYLREVTRPRVGEALARHGRDAGCFRVGGSVLVATGRDEEETAASVAALRARVAFYGSTPAYRPVLAHHGWGDLADRLHGLSKSGRPDRWQAMADLMPDEVVHTIGVVADPDDLAARVADRYRGLLDRVSLNHPGKVPPELLDTVSTRL
ncbi:TIGR03617 family F420-dependent LLM class oxidoreductase [Actinomadura rugatobispora]|uniref:TIGR03617 family F420-dependent LLM class oxidoreductase n=1 Tax=Actinomadura rugatobispora TaxID=1994 RepID=A0ABW1A301_9ACTN|nr:LLM class F420-dependent oxidoreductase [Actinomadura rugatobispora]